MKSYLSLLAICLFCSIVTAQSESCPCCSENHAAFDFWVGNWFVTDADGNELGRNLVEKIQDGCIVRENWSSPSGNTGTSMNFYNLKTKLWEQLWIDNSGTDLKLQGSRIANQMILSSDEFTHTDGKNYVNRISWTLNDDGTVRQLWEVLEGGVVVNVAFDGLYNRLDLLANKTP